MATLTPSPALPTPTAYPLSVSAGSYSPASGGGMVLGDSNGGPTQPPLPIIGSSGGVDGYTVRAGDTLLVVDATGKMTGLLPT